MIEVSLAHPDGHQVHRRTLNSPEDSVSLWYKSEGLVCPSTGKLFMDGCSLEHIVSSRARDNLLRWTYNNITTAPSFDLLTIVVYFKSTMYDFQTLTDYRNNYTASNQHVHYSPHTLL